MGKSLSLLARRDQHQVASDILLGSGERVRLGAVIRAGCMSKSKPGIEFDRGLRIWKDYAIVLLLSGAGNYRNSGGYKTRVEAGDLIWVFPGQGHFYGPAAGDRWEEIYLVFTGGMFDQWRETGLIDTARPIWRAEPVAHWQHRFSEVIPPEHPIGELTALSAAGRLLALIADLASQQESRAGGMTRPPAWLEGARIKLTSGIPAAVVASSLSLSYDTFRRRFTAATGLAPARYQLLGRIQQACALLRDDTVPIKVIAERTGFADEFHFSKRFRQIVGLPPGRFRDQGR